MIVTFMQVNVSLFCSETVLSCFVMLLYSETVLSSFVTFMSCFICSVCTQFRAAMESVWDFATRLNVEQANDPDVCLFEESVVFVEFPMDGESWNEFVFHMFCRRWSEALFICLSHVLQKVV